VRVFHSAGFAGFKRHALHVRVSGAPGEVDVITTHLASSTDNATSPCDIDSDGDEVIDTPCPDECVDAGAATVRECQVVQLVAFVEDVQGTSPPAVVTGDFNAVPSSNEYAYIEAKGWRDTYLAVGNPECNAGTGEGCTSGRDSSSTTELESTAANVDRRIDYTFLAPSPSFCVYSLDGPNDDDGDGTATRIFADDPNPFASCGASPSDVCWPSDHEGTELDMNIHQCAISGPIPAVPSRAMPLLGALLWLVATLVFVRRSTLLRH
jgi:hypothetical protein